MHDSRFASVTRSFTEGGTFIEVAGELDASVAADLRRVLVAAIVAGGLIEVDLGGVTFADSFGLSAVLDAKEFAEQYRVGLRVTATTPAVQRILGLSSDPDLLGTAVSNTA